MTFPNYRTPDSLLAAYYAARGEDSPADRAYAWLRSFALRGDSMGKDSVEYAETVLDSSVLDVEDLAQNFLGLDLYIDDLSPFDAKAGAPVFGIASPETGSIKICLRAAEYLPLYRSTVMHEVAHMLLHRGKRCYSPGAPHRPPEEREADQFMADALLPKSILYLGIVLAGLPYQLQVGEALGAANTKRGRFQWRKFFFPFFVNRLCVSRELVAVGLSQRRKFDGSTFQYHRTYALPNRWQRAKPLPLTFASIIEAAMPVQRPEFVKVAECWNAWIPKVFREHCGLDSFVGGTLTVKMDSSAHLYELQQLLAAGLREKIFAAAAKTGLKKIVLRPGSFYDTL